MAENQEKIGLEQIGSILQESLEDLDYFKQHSPDWGEAWDRLLALCNKIENQIKQPATIIQFPKNQPN